MINVLSSYRNQSIDLQSRSIDWFLYDKNAGVSKVNIAIFLVIIFQALKEIRLNHLQMLMIMSQFGLFICIPIWIFIDTPVMTQDVNLVGNSYPFT